VFPLPTTSLELQQPGQELQLAWGPWFVRAPCLKASGSSTVLAQLQLAGGVMQGPLLTRGDWPPARA